MSERDKIRNEYIKPAIHKWSYTNDDEDKHLADYIMEALDSWIEEQQPEASKYPDGRRVKMIDNRHTSDNVPHLNVTGTLVDKHKDAERKHLVLVEWDEWYPDFHDGYGDTESRVRCHDNRGWWVPNYTLEVLE